MTHIYDWCYTNTMIILPGKTNSMVFTTRQEDQLCPPQLRLILQKTDIEQVHEQRPLGVMLDAEMKW